MINFKKYLFKRGREDTCGHTGNTVYSLGFIGAAIYYISTATTVWMGILGILKAIVWPAVLVYGLLKLLGI